MQAAVLVAALVSGACAGEAAEVSRDDGALHLVEVRDAGGPTAFERRVPRLRGEPADTLRLGRVIGDSLDFARISSVRQVGARLVITDRQMTPHVTIADLASGRVERRLGAQGEGPGEFRDPLWTLPVGEGTPSAWIYDFQLRRMTRVNLDEPGPPASWDIRTMDAGVSLLGLAPTRDGFVANGLFPGFTLLVLDSAGRPLRRLRARPAFTQRELAHPDGQRMAGRSFLAARPGGDRIALVYQFRSRIDFFTATGGWYGSVRGPRETTPSFEVRDGRFVWRDDNEMAYWGAYATDRYVYALFCGCKLRDRGLPTRIHVFTWDGEFVAEYAFDRPVTEFTVREDDRVVYAATDEPHHAVGAWALPAAPDALAPD